MSEHADPQAGIEGQVVVAGRYQVHTEQPLPRLASPLATACAATDLHAGGRGLFALICRPDLLPRLDLIPTLRRLDHLPVVCPVDAGPAHWPESGGRRFCIIFEQPLGARVVASSTIESAETLATPLRSLTEVSGKATRGANPASPTTATAAPMVNKRR